MKSKRFLWAIFLVFCMSCVQTSNANTEALGKSLEGLQSKLTELSKILKKLSVKSGETKGPEGPGGGELDEGALKVLRENISKNKNEDFKTILKPLIQQYIDGQERFDCSLIFNELFGSINIEKAVKMLFDSKKCAVNKNIHVIVNYPAPKTVISAPPILLFLQPGFDKDNLFKMFIDQDNFDISFIDPATGRSPALDYVRLRGADDPLIVAVLSKAKKQLGDKLHAFIDRTDSNGCFPLFGASFEATRRLLEFGANPNRNVVVATDWTPSFISYLLRSYLNDALAYESYIKQSLLPPDPYHPHRSFPQSVYDYHKPFSGSWASKLCGVKMVRSRNYGRFLHGEQSYVDPKKRLKILKLLITHGADYNAKFEVLTQGVDGELVYGSESFYDEVRQLEWTEMLDLIEAEQKKRMDEIEKAAKLGKDPLSIVSEYEFAMKEPVPVTPELIIARPRKKKAKPRNT